MSQLVVRNLEPAVIRKLRQRAAADGVSMEEEHRRILRNVLFEKAQPSNKKSLKEYLLTMPADVPDSDFARPAAKVRRVAL